MQFILNLVYPEKSDLKYKIVRFSDSQIQFTFTDTEINRMKYAGEFLRYDDVCIYSRMSWEDVQVIIAAREALLELGCATVQLYVPYFLGARSDRKFEEGSVNYLKCVIGSIINELDFNCVQVMDPHSDVLEGVINNFDKIDNVELVKWALGDIYDGSEQMPTELIGQEPYVLVSPDAGALKKIYNVVEKIQFTGEIIVASKHRDIKTGKILSTEVPLHPQHALKDFVIIDDICDGGRTFIEISKKITETFPSAKIYLIVTHGIFSQGFTELFQRFSKIYTTNSVKDLPQNNFVKQLNVF